MAVGAEQTDIAGLVATARSGFSGLLIEGPAGIGKSFHWTSAVSQATAAGVRVLRARPSLSETVLVGSALVDVCGDVSDQELESLLPAPQCAALSAALLRAPGAGELDPRAVAISFATLIGALAASAPLLIAVDDIQWLDPQTEQVLSYAVRRVRTGLGVVVAWRHEHGAAEPGLVTALSDRQVSRWAVPALSPAALEVLLQQRLGTVAAPIARRAVAVSGGNPMFALEVASSLLAVGGSVSLDDVALPASLRGVVDEQLAALPAQTGMALSAAAALRRPELEQLAALGMREALAAAERAGVVGVDGSRVLFAHPLYEAGAYDRLTGSERMALHTSLAAVVNGLEERARHLALGMTGPDEQVAASLDAACARALARGALDAAADAARLAVRATAEDDCARSPRQIVLGRLLFRVGDTAGAVRELQFAADRACDDTTRARALLGHAQISLAADSQGQAMERALAALELADVDDSLALELLAVLADLSLNADDGAGYARRALTLLERDDDPDPARMAATLTQVFNNDFVAGRPVDITMLIRAIELEAATVPPPIRDRAVMFLCRYYHLSDQSELAEATVDEIERIAIDEDDTTGLIAVAHMRSSSALWAGHLDESERWATEASRLGAAAGLAGEQRAARWRVGLVLACRGDVDEVASIAQEQLSAANMNIVAELHGRALVGYSAGMRGVAADTVVHLGRVLAILDELACREPGQFRWITEYYVEALIAVGRLNDARSVTADYERSAVAVQRRSALAAAARCRCLLLAEAGDVDAALRAADEALQWHADLDRPVERARTLLIKGQVHRRFRQSGAARHALTDALGEFERIGMAGLAGRARSELARVSLRRAAATQELTETERRVAELTAQGMTAAQTAAALFVSPKTVSANLTKVYRKLGVSNRVELTARLAARD